MPRRLIVVLFALCLPLGAQGRVPTPAEHLGFEPGTDRKLADYGQVCAYFEKLAATSGRVTFSRIGSTTKGADLMMAVISAPANLAALDEILKTNRALADPRKLEPGDAGKLVARGKTIMCLNASIHSVEVGPTQATLPLAHFLATTQDPEWMKVLDDVVLLMIPCHNPDGYLKQVEWYRRWVGTPHEGCPLPGLYHTYAGHDNNRDWFMFNLQETRVTVKEVYLKWLPQIVMDSHQMWDDGPRMFLPPYQDPVEPNVDPILIERLNELGLTVQKELLAKGLAGIVNRTLFDAWSPSRSYPHYHGGVRFLCEIASCRQASPIERKGLDRRATTRPDLNPVPWKGERWALADVVRYHNETAMAVLRHASRNREQWLKSFHEVFRKACSSTDGPAAFVVPPARGPGRCKLLEILSLSGLECEVTRDETEIDGRKVGPQAIVIPARQPYFGFARALLQDVPYPRAGGTIPKPYDVTAHVLPLLLDVEVLAVDRLPATDSRVGIIDPRQVPELWQCGEGSPRAVWPSLKIKQSDVAVYRPFVTNVMDEGWTRLLLDEEFFDGCKTPYRSLTNRDLASLDASSGSRVELPKVLILPSLTADMILNGNRADEWPPEYRGGIGEPGLVWIDKFVRGGGTLIALKDATALPIQLFRLPLRNALVDLTPGKTVDIPGAILKVDLHAEHDLTHNVRPDVAALFDGGKAFDPDDHPDVDRSLKPVVIGRWGPVESVRLAGYAEGLHLIAGKPALVQCDVGKGQVILFGFSPQFRCQTFATFALLRNAIASGLLRN